MSNDTLLTPLMRQYHEIKAQFPDALVLFQVGDFYELFYEDAQKAAAYLGITLTSRGTHNNKPIPLCGVPVHVIDHYLLKLVRGGFRVVMCDQVAKAQYGKIIERRVSQVLTPGTLTDLTMLNEKSASFIAALVPTQSSIGIVFAELLTGQLFVTVLDTQDERLLEAELSRFLPDEIVVLAGKQGKETALLLGRMGYITTEWAEPIGVIREQEELKTWLDTVASEDAANFVGHSDAAQSALALLYEYLKKNCESALDYCKQLCVYHSEDYLILDAATQRNLELVKNLSDSHGKFTLFGLMDKAVTPMGSRQIKKWLLRPLVKQEHIEQRLDAVEMLCKSVALRREVRDLVAKIGDLERIVGRIALGRALLYDYLGLKRALEVIPYLEKTLGHATVVLVQMIRSKMDQFGPLYMRLKDALYEERTHDWRIAPGYNAELDRLRQLAQEGAAAIAAMEQREQASTGIASLKIRYNKIHGYGIEVTKANTGLVPPHYVRLQTLANRERYTMQELKDLEYDIERASNMSIEIEDELFNDLIDKVRAEVPMLKKLASAIAHLDALIGFAECAYTYNYVRPQFTTSRDMVILEGRHPVVEAYTSHTFIPNDTTLIESERLWIITGPNMGGKSTYLRQVALMALMAQSGSFVPARQATLPLIDRIFTRLGSADNVAEGKSTFLVEMEEAALICTQATRNSLVILDEVGRGTSTYDGLALAQSIIEYIYSTIQARCLFATHYHELTKLHEQYPGIVAYHAASKETTDGVLLLHKIVRGIAAGSFGLDVARRAGLPQAVLTRAATFLTTLTQHSNEYQVRASHQHIVQQVSVCMCKQKLAALDIDAITPRQAFDILCSLKQHS